jgi:hypothetical protein
MTMVVFDYTVKMGLAAGIPGADLTDQPSGLTEFTT